MASLDDGPDPVRGNKLFPFQVAFGHSVCHSNRKQTRKSCFKDVQKAWFADPENTRRLPEETTAGASSLKGPFLPSGEVFVGGGKLPFISVAMEPWLDPAHSQAVDG